MTWTSSLPRCTASPGDQLAAWSETFLLPLVAALERSQVTIREQAETIGEPRERLARHDAAQTTIAGQEPASGPVVLAGALLPLWRRYGPLSVGALEVIIVLAGMIWPVPR